LIGARTAHFGVVESALCIEHGEVVLQCTRIKALRQLDGLASFLDLVLESLALDFGSTVGDQSGLDFSHPADHTHPLRWCVTAT
jgi:hypothetical protein